MESINIEEIVEITIQKYEKKQKNKIKQKAFRNTKLLMKNYNDFKKHIIIRYQMLMIYRRL
jgi:hypothetical protein